MIKLKNFKDNLLYIIDYSYKSDRSNCNCDDICRCGRIVNTRINHLNGVYKELLRCGTTTLEKYILDRLYSIYKLYDISNYHVLTCGGYYGEEVYGIGNDNIDKLIEQFNSLQHLSLKEVLLDLLKLEYQYIPNFLSEASFKETTLELNTIDSMMSKKDECELNATIPIAIFYDNGYEYRIIDGNHRLNKAKNINLDLVSIYLASNKIT